MPNKKSVCDGCVKSDVCVKKDVVQATEREILRVLEKGVVNAGRVTFDNPKLSPSYDLKNMGVSAVVNCTSRLKDGYTED